MNSNKLNSSMPSMTALIGHLLGHDTARAPYKKVVNLGFLHKSTVGRQYDDIFFGAVATSHFNGIFNLVERQNI